MSIATQLASTAVRKASRPLGRKEIYLPNFTIQLLRTDNLPPSFASFIVPLNLNKLDLRDYLLNVYGVPVRSVRSYIQQQKIRQDKPGAKRPKARKWHRPRSIKKMLVELERPFAWPEVPQSFDAWDKKTYEKANEDREEQQNQFHPDAKKMPTKERKSIAEQAALLLDGKQKWTSTTPNKTPDDEEWEDFGDEVEVETDVDVAEAEKQARQSS